MECPPGDTVELPILAPAGAAWTLLFVANYGEGHALRIARTSDLSLSMVQRQLLRLEANGMLVCRMVRNARVFSVNERNPTARNLRQFLAGELGLVSNEDVHRYFRRRQRPRRSGKPLQLMRGITADTTVEDPDFVTAVSHGVFSRDSGTLRNGRDGADLVGGLHDAEENGGRRDGAPQIAGIDAGSDDIAAWALAGDSISAQRGTSHQVTNAPAWSEQQSPGRLPFGHERGAHDCCQCDPPAAPPGRSTIP